MITAALILAAGSASRMQPEPGQPVPKMLLPWKGKPILLHILDAVKSQSVQPWVVTGCYRAELENFLRPLQVFTIHHPYWANGMGSSIAAGVQRVMQANPALEKIFILPADQPLINGQLLHDMLALMITTQKGLVACRYGTAWGTPALFSRAYFSELVQLNGQAGAKTFMQAYVDDLALIDFPHGALDIDTPEDYAALRQQEGITDPIPPAPGG